MIASDGEGRVIEIPELLMTGMTIGDPKVPNREDLIRLPRGSDLHMLPGRKPIGYDPVARTFVTLDEYGGFPVFAVAAFVTPGRIQVMHSAYQTQLGAPRLPLFSYSAVGWWRGGFHVAGMAIDRDPRHDPTGMDPVLIERRAAAMLRRYPRNRLVRHLVENCVRCYACPSARNFVLCRWECPVAVSSACNSRCLGCLSKQAANAGIESPQERIGFVPTVDEIVEYAVPHLESAPRPMVSFGQGCEGEPLLEGDLIRDAIVEIRKRTNRGIINMNTNGSLPQVIERLCQAGLDSIRVSMNSAQDSYYTAFYRPRGYGFSDVVDSIGVGRSLGKWVSVNYLVFPGFVDTPDEMAALTTLMRTTRASMIQARNLNIDPEWYIACLQLDRIEGRPVGIRSWVEHLRTALPAVRLGCFNPASDINMNQ